MSYVTIEEAALDEIVSNRFLQTIEYELGKNFVAYLRGESLKISMPKTLRVVPTVDGVVFLGESAARKSRFLVIDKEQSGFFSSSMTNQNCLFVLQKTLRFTKKLWEGLSTTFSEMIPPHSSKAILFPFGHAAKPFRVVMEREPWSERLGKRGFKGRCFLVYKAGFDSGDSRKEQANETTFRKAFEQFAKLFAGGTTLEVNLSAAVLPKHSLQVTQVDYEGVDNKSLIYRMFDTWRPLLTNSQQVFVETPISNAHRIEGAAGTGRHFV